VRHPALAALALALAGCGARSSLEVDGAIGAGGAGGASSTDVSSSVSVGTGGSAPSCDSLVLVDPIVPLPSPAAVTRAPELGLLPEGDAWLSVIESGPGVPGLLRVGRTNAFTSWPPDYQAMVELDPGVTDYVTGPGVGAPVALLEKPSGPFLATSMLSTIEGIPFDTAGAPLFAVGIPDRFLAASGFPSPDYDVLNVESYQPSALPLTEPPLVCTDRPSRAAAVPTSDGFLAAYATTNPPECTPDGPRRPSVVMVVHHTAGPGLGSPLAYEETDYVVMDDTVLHVALAPASFGAWEVFQAAGDSAFQPPPIMAQKLGPTGLALGRDAAYFPVSPEGVSTPLVSVTTLGDALVVAWIDNVDPSAPTIIVQLVRPDGSLGASASIPTNAVWQTGRLRMTASADLQHLLVAWEGSLDEVPTVGLARLDCFTGL
jgi:hypothetical protein